jgi:hypothetical protein
MNRYKQKVNSSSCAEYQVLQEVKALAASQHLDFTEFLHRMFLNELDRHREIRVLEN